MKITRVYFPDMNQCFVLGQEGVKQIRDMNAFIEITHEDNDKIYSTEVYAQNKVIYKEAKKE